MSKPAFWLLALSVAALLVPLGVWLKFQSDAHARKLADPAYQRQVEAETKRAQEEQRVINIVATLALREDGKDGSMTERKRVAFLVQELARKYSMDLEGACRALILVRTELITAGVDQPCIPIMEAMNFSHDWSRENVDTFSAKLAIYMTGRKSGRSHESLARALSD